MTQKQRVLAAICGKPRDRLPFCSRIELWYNYHSNESTLPQRHQGLSEWDLQRNLSIGIVGHYGVGAALHKLLYRDMDYRVQDDPAGRTVNVDTPRGPLNARWTYPAELKGSASTTIQTEPLFKSACDYPALQYLIEHTEPVENYQACEQLATSIGDDGVLLPFTGKVPLHMLMEDFMGYERFYYEWFDNRAQVEALHEALCQQQINIMQLAAAGPGDIVEVGGNYDEHMTPPPIFESHMLPFYRQACDILHGGGKLVAVHGDGQMRKLLELLRDSGVDVVESITPEPMTSIRMAKLRKLWAEGPAIWGGLPAVIFTPTFSEQQFRSYVDDLLLTMQGHPRFILGFGDNVPTDAVFERVEYVAELAADQP